MKTRSHIQPTKPPWPSYAPVNPGSRVSSGLGRDGMFSYQIDGKDVTDIDGFGAAVGHDRLSSLQFGFNHIPTARWDAIFRKD